MLHDLDQENLQIYKLILLQNPKSSILGVFFPQNPALSAFTLKAP